MTARSKYLSFALVSAALGLAAGPPNGPRGAANVQETRKVLRSEQFVSRLLENTAGEIRRDAALEKTLDRLAARERFLLLLTPRNDAQARSLQRLLQENGGALARTSSAFDAARSQLDKDLSRNASAILTLDQISTNNPRLTKQLSNFELQAIQTFARQSAQRSRLFGLPPATPIIPF